MSGSEKKIWFYDMGTWTESTADWWVADDPAGDIDRELTAMGYLPGARFGLMDGPFEVVIYSTRHNGTDGVPEFLVEVSLGSYVYYVAPRNWPSLLQLLREVAPLSSASFGDLLVELQRTAYKAFLVWHGHDVWACCKHCDPAARSDAMGLGRRGDNRDG